MIERGRSVVGFFSGGKTAILSHGWETVHLPLIPYTLPRYTARPKRQLKRAAIRAKRLTRSQMRKARVSILRYYRSQYYPTAAWADLRIAVLRNEDIVINSFIMMFILGFAVAVTAFDFSLLFLNTAYDISTLTGVDMGILLLIVGGVLTSLGLWVGSFLTNLMSLAIMDGANRKLKCTVRSTFRHALHMASAVSTAWFMIGVRCAMPILTAAIAGVIYLKYFYSAFSLPLPVWAVMTATMMTWSIINFLRYSLVPYIVLFEQAPIPYAFKKSKALLRNRGKVFLLSLYLCLAAALGTMYAFSFMIDSIIGYNKYLIFSILAVAGLIGTNGVLVMLYRKRKLARR